MTPIDRFERALPAALTELAEPRVPDYFTDVLGQTARTRQRPTWASLERWLPMDTTVQRVPFARGPMRQVAILLAIGLLLVIGLAVVIGSRNDQPITPAPLFGPARNGLIPYAVDGDLFTGDPATGASTALLTGPTYDVEPAFTRDGTRIVFARQIDPADATRYDLFIMDADGTDLRQITTEPLVDPHWWDPSPDGKWIATITSGQEDGTLQLWSTESPGPALTPVDDMDVDGPSFRPPVGNEILFRGRTGVDVGLYVLDVESGAISTLVEPGPSTNQQYTLRSPKYSPDGSQIAFQQWDETMEAMRLYVMDADGTGRRELAADPDLWFTGWPVWSNDGTRVAVVRGDLDLPSGFGLPLAIVDVRDGSVIETGPALPSEGAVIEWAPDDSAILARGNDMGAVPVLLDPAGGPPRPLGWTTESWPNWQRQAD